MGELTVDEIPELPGYISVAAVAAKYSVHKGTIYYMIKKQRKFQHVFKINTSAETSDPRPLLILMAAEVEKVFAEKTAPKPLSPVKLMRAWNQRAKTWGRDHGFPHVHVSGPPSVELARAYAAANADDPRPE